MRRLCRGQEDKPTHTLVGLGHRENRGFQRGRVGGHACMGKDGCPVCIGRDECHGVHSEIWLSWYARGGMGFIHAPLALRSQAGGGPVH